MGAGCSKTVKVAPSHEHRASSSEARLAAKDLEVRPFPVLCSAQSRENRLFHFSPQCFPQLANLKSELAQLKAKKLTSKVVTPWNDDSLSDGVRLGRAPLRPTRPGLRASRMPPLLGKQTDEGERLQAPADVSTGSQGDRASAIFPVPPATAQPDSYTRGGGEADSSESEVENVGEAEETEEEDTESESDDSCDVNESLLQNDGRHCSEPLLKWPKQEEETQHPRGAVLLQKLSSSEAARPVVESDLVGLPPSRAMKSGPIAPSPYCSFREG